MAEKRQIDDDELIEITGAGEFDAGDFEADEFEALEKPGARPEPGSGGVTGPDHDNQSGGHQEFGQG